MDIIFRNPREELHDTIVDAIQRYCERYSSRSVVLEATKLLEWLGHSEYQFDLATSAFEYLHKSGEERWGEVTHRNRVILACALNQMACAFYLFGEDWYTILTCFALSRTIPPLTCTTTNADTLCVISDEWARFIQIENLKRKQKYLPEWKMIIPCDSQNHLFIESFKRNFEVTGPAGSSFQNWLGIALGAQVKLGAQVPNLRISTTRYSELIGPEHLKGSFYQRGTKKKCDGEDLRHLAKKAKFNGFNVKDVDNMFLQESLAAGTVEPNTVNWNEGR